MTKVEKECRYCKSIFLCKRSEYNRRKFCSKKCMNLSMIKYQICYICGNKFYSKKKNKFCSDKCRRQNILSEQVEKRCAICGKIFYICKFDDKHDHKICCSKKCSDIRIERMREIRKCVQCVKEFKVAKSIQKKFCSKECRKKYLNRNKVKEICVICGAVKYVSLSRHRTNTPICGKKECKIKSLSIQREGINNPHYKGRVKKVNCIICGKECKDYIGNKSFCSQECKGKWQKENLCGENGYFYGHHHTEEVKRASSERNRKGLRENINRAIRGSGKYKEWRVTVYKKANYTCKICGIKGGYLHAHHIKPLSQLIEEYLDIEKKYLEDPFGLINDKYFWNIENGECCHSECHYKTYHIKNIS
jgi:hypothetical protein